MANALLRIFTGGADVAAIKNSISDLESKRAAAAARLEGVDATRRSVAYDASQGNAEAQATLERAGVDRYELQTELEDLDAALAGARERLAAEEAKVAADALRAKAHRLRKLAHERLDAAKDVDVALADLAKAIDRLHQHGRAMEVLRAEILRATGQPLPIGSPLEEVSVGVRLREVAARYGLAPRHMLAFGDRLGLGFGSAATFAEAEAPGHRAFDFTDNGRPVGDEAPSPAA